MWSKALLRILSASLIGITDAPYGGIDASMCYRSRSTLSAAFSSRHHMVNLKVICGFLYTDSILYTLWAGRLLRHFVRDLHIYLGDFRCL